MRTLLFLGLILGNLLACFAQNPTSPLQFTLQRQNDFTFSNTYHLQFEKTYKKYKINVLSHHDNLYNKVLEKPFVQVFFQHQLWQYYEISPKISLVSWLDGQQYIQNQNFRFNIYKGVEYKPFPYLSITPLIGYSWDRLNLILNQGISPALKLASAYSFKDGTQVQASFVGREKYINPRHQRNISLKMGLQKQFEDKANVALEITSGTNEIDNFKGNAIEKIQSDSLGAAIQVQYQPFKSLQILSENQYLTSQRKFNYKTYQTTISEFNNLRFTQNEFRTAEKISYQQKNLLANISYSLEYNDRNYSIENNTGMSNLLYKKIQKTEEQKNFKKQTHSFEFNIQKNIFQKHDISLNGFNRYVMYDTPSEENFDDHDELIYGLQSEWNSKWRKNFSTKYKLEGSKRQYAFLFKEKSRDNYSQYMLRTEFEANWFPSAKWEIKAEQWLYVTYNVKDFQDITFSNRSTRNLETRLKSTFKPSDKWVLQGSLYRKEAQVSYLDWDAFSESTLDTTRTFIAEEKNEYNIFQSNKNHSIWINVGYKHFHLYRLQNTLMYDKQNILSPINLHKRNFQTGFITGIKWNHTSLYSYLDFSVWWQYQRQDNIYRTIPTFPSTLSIYQVSDLEKISQAIRPYWDVKINIRF